MLQVSYVSRTPEPLSAEQLLDLLQQCRRNNQKRGITGMLLYANGTFLQAIEGEDRVMEGLVSTIWDDPRHADIQLLSKRPIERRQYADWSMGFERVTDETLGEIEGLRDFGAEDFQFRRLVIDEPVVEKLLDHFRVSHWNPLLGELDARDKAIQELRLTLARTRAKLEDAALVLESLVEANKRGEISNALIDLSQSALDSLRPPTKRRSNS